jgi:DNA invertase Pin-like site-specific DNA recombinase
MPIAVYLRQSSDRDKDYAAVDRQRDRCLDVCQRRWPDDDDIEEYIDNDTSATNGKPRPDYQRLLADLESGARTKVVSYHIDRLWRRVIEQAHFLDLAERNHVQLATASGEIDLADADQVAMLQVAGVFAAKEGKDKARRQKNANRQRAQAGRPWAGPNRPFGYTYETEKNERGKVIRAWNSIVDEEADAIRKAYKALLTGKKTLGGIAAEWNTAGLTTVNGKQWTGGSVRQVLLRARNCGKQVTGTRASSAASKIQETILDDAPAQWDAIVSVEDWESVRKLLSDPKRHTGRSPGRKHLLSGIARCGAPGCDHPLTSGSRQARGGGRKAVYICKARGCQRILRDLASVDEVVVDAITRVLARPDWAATTAPSVNTAAIRDQINALQRQIAETEHDYDTNQISAKRMNAKIDLINQQLAPLHDKLLGQHTGRDVKALAGKPNARALFDKLPLDRQRGVIDAMAVVTVRVQGKGSHRFDPTSVTVEQR